MSLVNDPPNYVKKSGKCRDVDFNSKNTPPAGTGYLHLTITRQQFPILSRAFETSAALFVVNST